MATKSSSVFEADPEGFRETNAGRPPPHLIRELVQNAFDEKATRLEVTVAYESGAGVRYAVVDDVAGGIRDERLIWTIWLSDKADEPTKRGRMGRGLKELISVSDHVLITTEGAPAIEFTRVVRGGHPKWDRANPRKLRPERGTTVAGQVKAWKAADATAVVQYLRRMRPPEGLTFIVNGLPVERRAAAESYELRLPTVVFAMEDGGRVQRERSATAKVELFAEEQPWIYEMGIPVEETQFPLSIDVAQRIPLREKRDTVTDSYRRELFARLVDRRVAAGLVLDEQLRDNHVLIAADSSWAMSDETKRRIVAVHTAGMPFARTQLDLNAATGQHLQAIPLRSLPEAIRGLVREGFGTDVRGVLSQMDTANTACLASDALTPHQLGTVKAWEWLAAAIGRPTLVRFALGKPSAVASYAAPGKPGEHGVLTIYADNFGGAEAEPFGAKALATFIHELAHWSPQAEAHGAGFHSDAEQIGAQVAATLLKHSPAASVYAIHCEPSFDSLDQH